jgi:imidazolonepropionase-like amidohydrolase
MSALRPYSSRFREGTNQIVRVEIAPPPGAPPRPVRWLDPVPHKSIGMRETGGPVWSPDGTQMAAVVDGHLVSFPVDRDGTPAGPLRRLSPDVAGTPSWTADSRRVLYQAAGRLRLVDTVDGRIVDVIPRLSFEPPAPPPPITVHAGRLFDGLNDAVHEDVDVVIEDGRIARIEPHRDTGHTGTLIDASGQTVLPGLIESHTHLARTYGEALGRIWLAFGVTTVRNPAVNPFEGLEEREAYLAGARPGPRVLSTGEPFDGTRIYYPGGTALDGGAQVASRIAWAREMRFDFVKTYVRLPDLLQQRIIEDAHGLGLPVTSHEIYPAVAYGADGVEHIRGTSRRGFSPKMSELRRSYRDVVDLLTSSGMTLTPTIGIQGGHQLLTLRDAAWIDDPRIQQMFPSSATTAARGLRDRAPDPADLAMREALVGPQERLVARVVRGGGRVIGGTDSPIIPYGLSLLMELEHYVRGGLTPAEALRTATSVAAEAMGAADQIGVVAPGRLADLVIVDGNPLVAITDLRRTRRVVKGGVVYDVDRLLEWSAQPQ